jgi:hypothetical protein
VQGAIGRGCVWSGDVGSGLARRGKVWVKPASHAVHLRVSSSEVRCAIGLDWYGDVGFGEVMPA